MKLIFIVGLFSSVAFGAKIPVDTFDQSKLETLLRKIPSALVRTESFEGFVRKHTFFPNQKQASFSIKCQADYFGKTDIPSFKACELDVSSTDIVGDEYLIQITDSLSVQALRESISYGDELKKFYSFERVYGQGHDGIYKNLFRYSVICKPESCEVTMTPKKAL